MRVTIARLLIAVCSGADALPSSAPAREANPSAAQQADSIANAVDDLLTRLSGFGYSGNVLITRHDSVILERGYGLANRAARTAYDANTIFDIGSMSKTFTAAAVLKLELAKRLTLADSLAGLLPGVPADKRAITVEQLLTHSGGIASDFPYTDPSIPYEDVGRDEAVRRLLAAPLEYAPGTASSYSNGGYILLAAIVERASGEPFRDYMRDSIFLAAGLTHTAFWGDPRLDRTHVALGYDEYGRVLHDPTSRSDTTWQDLGGGQVVSTLGDLARWRSELAAGHVLPPAAVTRLWTAHTTHFSPRGEYGYGWFIGGSPHGTLIQHGGDYLGTGANLEWFRDDGVVVISSTNVRHDYYPTQNRINRPIDSILFGGKYILPPSWVGNDTLLRAVRAEYRLRSGGALVIHERGGRTYIGARGQDATDLLVPGTDSALRRRARLTALAERAIDGVRTGDLGALKEAAGADPNPSFVPAVAKEVVELGRGPIRAVHTLGTFPSGFPRGHPLDYETTLLSVQFDERDTAYAIRWANAGIGATEVPAFTLAAEMPIQAEVNGSLSGWNIVQQSGVTIIPVRTGRRVTALRIRGRTG